MSPDQIVRFLKDFRRLHASTPRKSKLISIKIPEDLLEVFKQKARLSDIRYQTQIKHLMRDWVLTSPEDST